jgi:hypothetical protein
MNMPTEHDTLEIVSSEGLERELTLVRAAAAGSLSGIFGPRSATERPQYSWERAARYYCSSRIPGLPLR